MTRTFRIATLAALAALTAAAFAVAPALAKDGRDVRVSGACTQGSTAKLKLSPENGRIEVEFELDQNRVGVAWTATVRRNGARVATARAITRAPSGSFEIRRVVADRAGAERISVVATRASGERCTASASF